MDRMNGAKFLKEGEFETLFKDLNDVIDVNIGLLKALRV
jgi:hypothetical protein